MLKYKSIRPPRDLLQGFVFGAIFGIIGAVVMLGRQGRKENTL